MKNLRGLAFLRPPCPTSATNRMKKVALTPISGADDRDELRVTALGIGHGDSILLQWCDRGCQWTCLVDGGQSPDRLNQRLDSANVETIDLLVLTHLDTDHVGGLGGIASRRRVRSFWGPALAAFERHLWLFGQRGVEAIERGRALEDSLKAAKVDICYPLEGYTSSPHDNAVKLTVMSPPARLVRRLLVGDDVAGLFSHPSMPLGWLLDTEPPASEQGEVLGRLDASLSRDFLEPSDLSAMPTGSGGSPSEQKSLAEEWSAESGADPEFFGDSVLNNTSLVLYLEARTNGRLHRVLLPGDQENWTYLLGKNPRGIQADVLKGSHHGGRVYLEADLALDEVFSTIQPRVVLFSGNGQHGLPRTAVREAAIRWGATVACTCSRNAEFCGPAPTEVECCHAVYSCGRSQDVALVLDAKGIRSDRPACHSGLGRQPGRVVDVRQHIVDPSPLLSHLAENELRRHILWVQRKLKNIHTERVRLAPGFVQGSMPVSGEDLATLAREERRHLSVPHLEEVLSCGMRAGSFWSSTHSRAHGASHAYALPSSGDIANLLEMISEKAMLLFPKPVGRVGLDRDSLVNGLELEALQSYADAAIHFPEEMFREAIWPAVSKAFKGPDWHCFQHGSGAIAFSRQATIELLLQPVVRYAFSNDSRVGFAQMKDDAFKLSTPVLVSLPWKDHGAPSNWDRCLAVESWMVVRRIECPEPHWKLLEESGIDHRTESDGARIDKETLAGHTRQDPVRMAELLAPTVTMLW